MSEQRKRLTDAEVKDGYGACGEGPRPDIPCAPCRADLQADHLQAREDRKRLVDLVRAFMFEGRNLETLRRAKELLAEVDPQ